MLQIPAAFQGEEVRERLKKMQGGPQMPMTVHLRQEIDRLNTVIDLTRAMLSDLRLAIAGASGLSLQDQPGHVKTLNS